eukprot:5444958-Alexandrium_andersonii.AAC.1
MGCNVAGCVCDECGNPSVQRWGWRYEGTVVCAQKPSHREWKPCGLHGRQQLLHVMPVTFYSTRLCRDQVH